MKGLFVTDLDGTLLTSKKMISQEDVDSLSLLQRCGIVTVVATGRSEYSFNKLAEELERTMRARLPVDFVIFSTGAGVMDYPGRKILKNVFLNSSEVKNICLRLDDLQIDYMVHKSIPDTKYFAYRMVDGGSPDFQKRLTMYKEFGVPLTGDTLAELGNATEILCISPADRGHQVTETILQELYQFSVIKATSPLDGKSIWVEIFPPSVSKSNAVRWLAEKLNIPQKATCAVGNDFNDVDLLQWAQYSYLVDNAPSLLKKNFTAVASNDKGGVSQAVCAWRTSCNL